MDWSEAEISILVERLNLISRLSGGEVADAIVKSVDLITSLRLQTSELASAPLDMDASPLAVEDVMMRNQSLAIENALLRAERDEARRRYCFAMAEHGEEAEARQTAKEEGWDCFEGGANG